MDTDDPYSAYWEQASRTKTYTTPLAIDDLAPRLRDGALVLDVGCGYGRSMRELEARGLRAVGVDFAMNALARGRAQMPLNMAQASAFALPFPDRTFDAVVLLAVLTCVVYTADQQRLVAEAHRVLKPGGTICVNDFLLNEDARNLERYERFAPVYGDYGIFEVDGTAPVRHHTAEHVRGLLVGFEAPVLREQVFTTMNGNTARGFTFLGLA